MAPPIALGKSPIGAIKYLYTATAIPARPLTYSYRSQINTITTTYRGSGHILCIVVRITITIYIPDSYRALWIPGRRRCVVIKGGDKENIQHTTLRKWRCYNFIV